MAKPDRLKRKQTETDDDLSDCSSEEDHFIVKIDTFEIVESRSEKLSPAGQNDQDIENKPRVYSSYPNDSSTAAPLEKKGAESLDLGDKNQEKEQKLSSERPLAPSEKTGTETLNLGDKN